MSKMSFKKPSQETQDKLMSVKQRLMESIQHEIKSGEITNFEILSLMAYMTGMVLAMQDQRKMTPAQGMEIVSKNVEAGNRAAVDQLLNVRAYNG